MTIVSIYSHKNALEFIKNHHPAEWQEVCEIIKSIDASQAKTKISKEKTMPGRRLYSPKELNRLFKEEFSRRGWKKQRIQTKTRIEVYSEAPPAVRDQYKDVEHKGFREMDFVKNKLGVELQLGKYAFMVYNVAAKMTIFKKAGIIDAGVEIVAMRRMTSQMSTGVSYFEQVKADLEMRGESEIDVPALIVGVDDL